MVKNLRCSIRKNALISEKILYRLWLLSLRGSRRTRRTRRIAAVALGHLERVGVRYPLLILSTKVLGLDLSILLIIIVGGTSLNSARLYTLIDGLNSRRIRRLRGS